MKLKIYFLLVFFIFSCDDIGKGYKWQGNIPPGFHRSFGTIGYDYGWSSDYSIFDDGIVIVGQQTPQLNGKSNMWAIKTDTRGIMEWERSFGGDENDVGYDVIATSDGGFLFVGYAWSFGNSQQVYAVKTNFYGDVQWEKTYGGTVWDIGYAVIEVSDGGYIIAGSSNSPFISSGNTDMYLIKIGISGDILWEKGYGNLAYPNHEWAYDLQELPDKSFIVVGARDRYSKGSKNGYLIRINKNGDLIWEKELLDNNQNDETIYSISKSMSGSYYLCSTINSDNNLEIYQPKIIKIDGSGNIDWQRIFQANGRYYHQYRATTTKSGDIVIVGSSAKNISLGNKDDAFMTKIDSRGNIIWTYPYGTMDKDDWGWSIFETQNNNLVFVGSTKSFGASLFDIFLVSTNSDGISQ